MPGWFRTIQLICRNEFKKDVVVGDGAQQLVTQIFKRDKTFGTGVTFLEYDLVAAEFLFEEVSIGCEIDTTVDDAAQMWPDFGDAFGVISGSQPSKQQ